MRYVTFVRHNPGRVLTVRSPKQEIWGASESTTATKKEHVPTLPDASVALYETAVDPILKFEEEDSP